MRTMALFFAFAAAASLIGGARGEEPCVALALARARVRAQTLRSAPTRGAEVPTVLEVPADDCHEAFPTGLAQARATGKPLVVWVGMRCVDRPDVRQATAEAVHCHAADWEGDRGPYVVVRTPRGTYWRVRQVSPDAVRNVLHAEPPPPAATSQRVTPVSFAQVPTVCRT